MACTALRVSGDTTRSAARPDRATAVASGVSRRSSRVPALERFYESRAGERRALAEIADRAAHDAAAEATLRRLTDKFGEAIAAVINILDPDAIVIGGGVGNIARLYDPVTRDAIRRHLFNPELRTEILRPTLGDSAGVFGAALLVAGGG